MKDRKYLLMTAKHSSKEQPLFWGRRTEDNERRSFGGYTSDPERAELYTAEEILEEFTPKNNLLKIFPIEREFGPIVYMWRSSDWINSRDDENLFLITAEKYSECFK